MFFFSKAVSVIRACSKVGAGAVAVFAISAAAMAQAQTQTMPQTRSASGQYLAAIVAASNNDVSEAARFYGAVIAADPRSDFTLLTSRSLYWLLADGRIDEALTPARSLIEQRQTSRDGLAYLAVAVDHFRKGEFAALSDFVARDYEVGEVAAFLMKSLGVWSELARGRMSQARELAKSMPDIDGFGRLQEFHAALLDEQFSDPQGALARLQLIKKESRGDVAIMAEARIRLLWRIGDLAAARAEAEESSAVFPNHPGLAAMRMALLRPRPGPAPGVSVRSGASKLFMIVASLLPAAQAGPIMDSYLQLALALDPNFASARFLLGNLREDRNQYDEAAREYRRIDRLSAYGFESRQRLAWALNRLERRREAEDILRVLARERPGDSDPLSMLGDMLRSHKEFARAAVVYSQAISRIRSPGPQNWSLFFARGISYERSKDWPRAEADLKQALALMPDQPSVLNYLGYSWIEKGINLEEGRIMIEKAVQQRPRDGHIVDSLGWAYYMMGQYEDAVRELERAVELTPEEPVINDHLGDAYWRVGRQREARFQWERALSFDPEPELRQQLQRKIKDGLATQ